MSPGGVWTGNVRVGRFTMVVGERAGTIVTVVEGAPPQPPPELVEALAAPPPPGEELQAAVEDAGEVTSKIERFLELFTLVAQGKFDAAAVSKELDAGLDLLERLDRAGRFDEALRVARPLQGLLALTLRWVSLVEALRVALHAAEALADSEALGWVRHELGSLGLGPRRGTRRLGRSRRRAQAAPGATAATPPASGDRAEPGDARAAFPPADVVGTPLEHARHSAIVAATVLALVVLGFGLASALNPDPANGTVTTGARPATSTDAAAPAAAAAAADVHLDADADADVHPAAAATADPTPTDDVAPRVAITEPEERRLSSTKVRIAGTAGDATGDSPIVRLTSTRQSADGAAVGEPIDVTRDGAAWDTPPRCR